MAYCLWQYVDYVGLWRKGTGIRRFVALVHCADGQPVAPHEEGGFPPV